MLYFFQYSSDKLISFDLTIPLNNSHYQDDAQGSHQYGEIGERERNGTISIITADNTAWLFLSLSLYSTLTTASRRHTHLSIIFSSLLGIVCGLIS